MRWHFHWKCLVVSDFEKCGCPQHLAASQGSREWRHTALSLALPQEQRKTYWPAMQWPQGKPPLRKRKPFWRREMTAAASFESHSLRSVSRASMDLRLFLSLAFPVNLHCVSDVTLPLYFWNYSSFSVAQFSQFSHLHSWRAINTLTIAGLCLSNLEIRESVNSEDQTLQILAAEMQQMKDIKIQPLYSPEWNIWAVEASDLSSLLNRSCTT